MKCEMLDEMVDEMADEMAKKVWFFPLGGRGRDFELGAEDKRADGSVRGEQPTRTRLGDASGGRFRQPRVNCQKSRSGMR